MDIKQMLEQKCSVGDCQERQGMYVTILMPNGLSQSIPFCMEHAMKFMELGKRMEANARACDRAMRNSNGAMVIINSWHELVRRLKPEFLIAGTQGLELTKGLCVDCGKPAFGIRTLLTPVCGECYGFPRKVLRCALK